jgi:hypothetical protein
MAISYIASVNTTFLRKESILLRKVSIYTVRVRRVPLGTNPNRSDDQRYIPSEVTRKVQYAFKMLMIHGELRFTLTITFHGVLHRSENQGIPCKNFGRSHLDKRFQITYWVEHLRYIEIKILPIGGRISEIPSKSLIFSRGKTEYLTASALRFSKWYGTRFL